MKLSTILAGSLSLLALCGAAQAADLIVADAPAAAVAASATDWSGFYVGVHGGYGTATEVLGAPVDNEADLDGVFGGVQIGYNFQADALVLGLQSDIALTGITNGEDPEDTIDWIGSTTARVGYALDGVLPYVKAGVAYAGGTGRMGVEEDSQTAFGWTAGAGIEFTLADNISLFGEYDYYDFQTTTFHLSGLDIDTDATAHTIKAGLNFAF